MLAYIGDLIYQKSNIEDVNVHGTSRLTDQMVSGDILSHSTLNGERIKDVGSAESQRFSSNLIRFPMFLPFAKINVGSVLDLIWYLI